MKRIIITGFALLGMFRLSGQTNTSDSTEYKKIKRPRSEINQILSYYQQDGNNAAVTGGIGSQKLNNISNITEVKLFSYSKRGIKRTFSIETGLDHYTSASSDQVDLQANSSASSHDFRFYPSVGYSWENEEKGHAIGLGLSSSTESDYQSAGANISFSKKTKDRSGEFAGRFQAYLDNVKMIIPTEFRRYGNPENREPRNTFAGTLSYAQIINKNFQVLFIAEVISQNGYLSLPFHRVYFTDGSVHQEKLPDSRFKVPIAVRGSYFFGPNVIIRAYYRYYSDSWDLHAHTADIEIPVKLSPFFSISPFYRYYTQSAIKYFDGFEKHTEAAQFYTSNYDYSKFSSNFIGMGLKITPANGILGNPRFNTIEVRYGHYTRTNDLASDIISLHLKFK